MHYEKQNVELNQRMFVSAQHPYVRCPHHITSIYLSLSMLLYIFTKKPKVFLH